MLRTGGAFCSHGQPRKKRKFAAPGMETSKDGLGCGNTNMMRQTWGHRQDFYVKLCKDVALLGSFYLLTSEMVILVCELTWEETETLRCFCIEGKEFMFAVGCFFVFCGTAGGSCGEAGKWCGAWFALKLASLIGCEKKIFVIWRCETYFSLQTDSSNIADWTCMCLIVYQADWPERNDLDSGENLSRYHWK